MTNTTWLLTAMLFIGAALGSLLLVYFRLSNPIEPKNGYWHGLLIVLFSALISAWVHRSVFYTAVSYTKVFLGIFVLANLGAIPGRVIAAMNQMNREETFVLHIQGVFGSLYGTAIVVICSLLWQR